MTEPWPYKRLTVTKEQRETVRERDIAASKVRVHVGPALRKLLGGVIQSSRAPIYRTPEGKMLCAGCQQKAISMDDEYHEVCASRVLCWRCGTPTAPRPDGYAATCGPCEEIGRREHDQEFRDRGGVWG